MQRSRIGGADANTLFVSTGATNNLPGLLARLSAVTGAPQWSVTLPEDAGPPIRVANTVWLVAGDGITLEGWSVTATGPTPLKQINVQDEGAGASSLWLAAANGTLAIEIWPTSIIGYRVPGT